MKNSQRGKSLITTHVIRIPMLLVQQSLDYKKKRRRPFSSKKALHVVLRSNYATLRNIRNRKLISNLLFLYTNKFGIKVYQNSLNSTHLHLLVKAGSKADLQSFLRVFSGQVAQKITGAVRGRRLKLSFWKEICWSRVIEWGRAFRIATSYVLQNQLESLHLIAYTARRVKGLRV